VPTTVNGVLAFTSLHGMLNASMEVVLE